MVKYYNTYDMIPVVEVRISSNPISMMHVSHSALDMFMFWAMHSNQIEYRNKKFFFKEYTEVFLKAIMSRDES